jgi:hypothetical protein
MIIRTVLLSALAMPTGLALAADAPFSDPSSLPKVSCDDIHYSEAFLQRYPKAPASCIEARIYNGEKWAKFKAKVYLVKLPDFITVEMLDVAGNPVETFSLKPDPNDKIVLDGGKSMSFSEVKAGDVITFWKSEKRLDAKAMPASTAASWLVLPPQKSQK